MASIFYNGEVIDYPSNEKEFNKWLNGIKTAFEVKNKDIQCLKEKIKKLEDEKWKDNELQNMKKTYDEMKANYYRGFSISKKEQNAINEWQKNHLTNQHNLKTLKQKVSFGGAIGGNFKFEFILTAIGTVGSCICESCQSQARKDSMGDPEILKALLKEYDAEFIFQDI